MNFRHLTGFLRNYGRISKGALERSSSTYSLAGELNARVGKWLLIQCWYVAFFNFHHSFQACHSSSRVVVTFDPSKFTEKKQRRFHISNVQYFQPLVALHNQSSPVGGRYKLYYNLTTLLRSLYPPDTAAILYYCTSPEKPHIAGELRLRVASSDHATFECGSDLLKLNGQPWCLKILYSSLRKNEGRWIYFRRLGRNFIDSSKSAKMSSNLYFKRYIYHRLQLL